MKARFWEVAPPTDRDLRNFGLIMAAAAFVFAAVAWHKGSAALEELLVAGACFALCASTWRRPLGPLYRIWMVIGGFLGFVNSHLLLALVFYLVFTPIGLVMRLLGRDPIDWRFDARSKAPDSYWIRREQPLLPRNHYERQF